MVNSCSEKTIPEFDRDTVSKMDRFHRISAEVLAERGLIRVVGKPEAA